MTATREISIVPLDIIDDASIKAAARNCPNINLLINNAAALANTGLARVETLEEARVEMETNYWGTLRMCRAFAPVMAAKGGGTIVNILSMGALASIPFAGSYCATKAATLSLTQCLRAELARDNILMIAAFPGPIATEMARPHEHEGRHPPKLLADNIVGAVTEDRENVFPDPSSSAVAELYAKDPWAVEKQFATFADD